MSPNHSPDFYDLPGPAALRKHFFPLVRINITTIARIIGLSRDRIYKRIRANRLDLKIQYDEANRPFVTIDDLIAYLYPSSPTTQPQPEPIRKVGRPRKSTGGAK
jgi:hypothetical protein